MYSRITKFVHDYSYSIAVSFGQNAPDGGNLYPERRLCSKTETHFKSVDFPE